MTNPMNETHSFGWLRDHEYWLDEPDDKNLYKTTKEKETYDDDN